MTRFGRLLALLAAFGGFAAAHVVTQAGQAQVPPITSVTSALPTLPVPVPPPTTTVPVPLPPPPTTTTAPLPVPVPPLPPAPTLTAPALPAPLPPSTTGTLPRIPSPAPSGTPSTPTPAAPPAASSPSPSAGPGASSSPSGSSATTGSRAATRPRALHATVRRTKTRVSVRLTFTLPRAGRVFLVVRGPAPSCRTAGVIPVRGRTGTNVAVFAGRVHGRRLEPGLYLVSVSTTRSVAADAPAELVRVVSRTRSVPAPASARRPSCSTATAVDVTGRISLRAAEAAAVPATPTLRPAAPLRPPLQDPGSTGNDGLADLLPTPHSLGADSGLELFAAIAVLTVAGALLLAMLALVTRFVRGSWNP